MELALAALGGAVAAMLVGFLLWGRALAPARAALEAANTRADTEARRAEAERARADAERAAGDALRDKARADAEALGRAASAVDGMRVQLGEAKAAAAELPALRAEAAELKATQAERDAAHARAIATLREEFARVAGEALTAAQERFAAQAEETLKAHRAAATANLDTSKAEIATLLTPVSETLKRYQAELKAIETERQTAYGGLAEQLANVAAGQQAVREEAARLSTALRSSGRTAGAWGEAQLRNVLEMGGLREGIDFSLQTSVTDEDDARLRPDATISLPQGRKLVIDSKCSLNDYMAAAESSHDDTRRAAMRRHAQAVRAHVAGLASKAYWAKVGDAADFVVLFMPGENFLSAALDTDMALLGDAMDKRVLLAGPINLLALARTVATVWRQEKLAEEAKAIGREAADLYDRLGTMAENVSRLGKNLGQSVSAYNAFVGSLEGRVLPSARRLTQLGVAGKGEIAELAALDGSPRMPVARELLPPANAAE